MSDFQHCSFRDADSEGHPVPCPTEAKWVTTLYAGHWQLGVWSCPEHKNLIERAFPVISLSDGGFHQIPTPLIVVRSPLLLDIEYLRDMESGDIQALPALTCDSCGEPIVTRNGKWEHFAIAKNPSTHEVMPG